jgi:hypothetical protein
VCASEKRSGARASESLSVNDVGLGVSGTNEEDVERMNMESVGHDVLCG